MCARARYALETSASRSDIARFRKRKIAEHISTSRLTSSPRAVVALGYIRPTTIRSLRRGAHNRRMDRRRAPTRRRSPLRRAAVSGAPWPPAPSIHAPTLPRGARRIHDYGVAAPPQTPSTTKVKTCKRREGPPRGTRMTCITPLLRAALASPAGIDVGVSRRQRPPPWSQERQHRSHEASPLARTWTWPVSHRTHPTPVPSPSRLVRPHTLTAATSTHSGIRPAAFVARREWSAAAHTITRCISSPRLLSLAGACHSPSQLLPPPTAHPHPIVPTSTPRAARSARARRPRPHVLLAEGPGVLEELSHGPAAMLSQPGAPTELSRQETRSGCGIIARWRPSSEQSAAMPCTEPLGLWGYASVIWLVASRSGSARGCARGRARGRARAGSTRPSPWATTRRARSLPCPRGGRRATGGS